MNYKNIAAVLFDYQLAGGGDLKVVPMKLSWTNDVLPFLPESMQQEWNCSTCREWFKKAMNVILVGHSGNCYSLPLCDLAHWPEEFHAAINNVREKIITHVGYTSANEVTGLGMRYMQSSVVLGALDHFYNNGRNIIGVKERGGFGHLHSVIMSASEMQDLRTARSAFITFFDKTKAVQIAQFVAAFEANQFSKQSHKENLKTMIDMAAKRGQQSMGRFLVDGVEGEKLRPVDMARTWNNSSVKTALLRFLDGHELQSALDFYSEMTDPLNFRRVKSEISEKQKLDLLKKLEKSEFKESLAFKLKTLADVNLIIDMRAIHDVPVEEKKQSVGGSLLDSLKEVKAEADEAKELPVAKVNGRELSIGELMRLMVGRPGAKFFFTTPSLSANCQYIQTSVNPDAPSIFKKEYEDVIWGWSQPASFSAIGFHPGVSLLPIKGVFFGGKDYYLATEATHEGAQASVPVYIDGEVLKPELYEFRQVLEDTGRQTMMEVPVNRCVPFMLGLRSSMIVVIEENGLQTSHVVSCGSEESLQAFKDYMLSLEEEATQATDENYALPADKVAVLQ